MDLTNLELYGFSILFIIYLYYLYKNIRENNLIILGSFLVTIGYFYATLEKYNYLYKQHMIYH